MIRLKLSVTMLAILWTNDVTNFVRLDKRACPVETLVGVEDSERLISL
ncbi:hypothetical protein BH10CHL1_BH10CHL1_28220 [soil metagenome]